ncbi:hypothetical protein ACFQI7_11485 [Paenibacillus allorhizosphaerae]|uniref:Uncharacterized protein n=1 Tax=Paenibacillus allorhizosphaerae TaxID=2849866 RepID=A0ABM8VHJ6_9BACL|nr:hypothetical protein [Paenibacillus allorhizosphaerae]CAG7641878.1 hypothetical protein PAECIP111802_02789 [Paenibacillus allorhizosphaerae]
MKTFNKSFPARVRRRQALISQDGFTYLRWQNPYIVAWWSISFPGFGHFLLHQYIRGFVLSFWEVIINTLTHMNEAIVYSFSGRFELATAVLEPKWVLAYLIVYLFAIWDSYIKAVDANQQYHLAKLEGARLTAFRIQTFNIVYIAKKRPLSALYCSFIFPGLGQLYNNRLSLGFYGVIWWTIYMTFSHSHESLILLILGRLEESKTILKPHWLLFMPSVIGGAMYDAYMTAHDNNQLLRTEQIQYLCERYPHFEIDIFPKAE